VRPGKSRGKPAVALGEARASGLSWQSVEFTQSRPEVGATFSTRSKGAARPGPKAIANPAAVSCLTPVTVSLALPGLTARLDKLVYHHGGKSLPPDKPHAFVYFITIHNGSEHTVTLLGRKWVVTHADGTQLVVEGDKIVGETPRLAAGEQFSYNSYHVTALSARSQGSFHGVDDLGRRVHVVLPPFDLIVPDETTPAGPGDR
jgi:ApaG protein